MATTFVYKDQDTKNDETRLIWWVSGGHDYDPTSRLPIVFSFDGIRRQGEFNILVTDCLEFAVERAVYLPKNGAHLLLKTEQSVSRKTLEALGWTENTYRDMRADPTGKGAVWKVLTGLFYGNVEIG